MGNISPMVATITRFTSGQQTVHLFVPRNRNRFQDRIWNWFGKSINTPSVLFTNQPFQPS